MLWTASQITWYLDGRALMSAPTYDSTNQPMYLLLQMWVGGWTLLVVMTGGAVIAAGWAGGITVLLFWFVRRVLTS